MKKRIFLLFISIYAHLISSGQNSPQAFSLIQAIEYAVQHGYSVSNAATDIEIARKKVTELRGVGIPQLNAEASFQNYIQVPVTMMEAGAFFPMAPPGTYLRLPFGLKYNLAYGYTASWLLFNGEYLVGLQASKTYVEYTKNNLRKTEAEVKEGVTRAYHLVLVLQKNKEILNASIETLKQSIIETEAIYKEGFIEELDVERLKLLGQNLESNLGALNQQLILAEKLLKFQMGFDVNAPISLSDTFESIVGIASTGIESEPSFDFNSSIESQMISSGLKLQQLSIKRTKANYLPSLNTYYSWRENRMGNEFDMLSNADFRVTGGNIFGLNLSMPLFQGLSQRSRVQQAKLDLKKLQTQELQARQGYMLQSGQALTDYQSALQMFQNAKESVNLAQKIKNKTSIKYKEGVGSSIELIQAENDLLNAQANFINTANQLLNARVTLDKQLNKF